MRVLKNLFGDGSKIHADEIVVGTSLLSRLLGASVIVESGINANGRYVKYGDGTLICWQKLTFANHVANTRATKNWIFPHAFVAPYSHTVSSTLSNFDSAFEFVLNYIVAPDGDPTTSAVTLSIGTSIATQTYSVGVIATGRWK